MIIFASPSLRGYKLTTGHHVPLDLKLGSLGPRPYLRYPRSEQPVQIAFGDSIPPAMFARLASALIEKDQFSPADHHRGMSVFTRLAMIENRPDREIRPFDAIGDR